MKKSPTFKSLISGPRTSSRFDSSVYFKESDIEELSPIKKFTAQRVLLTTILGAEEDTQEWNMKANLSIIGIVSSTESFFRATIRKTLIVDNNSRRQSYKSKLSYGAVLYHAPELLPEALLEDCNFISKKNIIEYSSNFLGIKISPQNSPALNSALDEFEKVCHLRHCVSHRSGHLGSKNAIELGLEEFSAYLEKPISPTLDAVNNVFNICQNLVLEFNDYLFECILDQSVESGVWTGDLRKDKKSFRSLFNIFSPTPDNESELKKLYEAFRKHFAL